MLNEDVPPYCLPSSAKVTIKGKNVHGKGTVVKINNPLLKCVVNLGRGSETFTVAEEDVKLVLRVGNVVQVRDGSGHFVEAQVENIQDNSHYVVALDGKDEFVLASRKNLTYLEDEEKQENLQINPGNVTFKNK